MTLRRRLLFVFIYVCNIGLLTSYQEVIVSMETESNNGTLLGTEPRLYYMDHICKKNPSLIQIRNRDAIRVSAWMGGYPPNRTTCVVGIESFDYQNYRLATTFKSLKMTSVNNAKERCEHARLDIYDGRIPSPRNQLSGRYGICGVQTDKSDYVTTGNFLLLKFSTYKLSPHTYENFEAVITPYYTGKCQKDEFKCNNGRCISKSLMCDGYNNCGDDSDEKSCSSLALSQNVIIGIIIGSTVLIGFVLIIVAWKCCRRRGYENL